MQPETILLDIYSGTGSIGLSLASKVKKLIGIEIVEDAVLDARKNASENGISNAEFVCGKAEEALAQVLKQIETGQTPLAIVDPPRSGLHHNAVKLIRGCSSINHLVYVSCNQNSMVNDVIGFCKASSNKFPGQPFEPKYVLSVDMFPHTEHCEAIMLLTR